MKRIDLQTIRAMADMIADTDDRDGEPGFLDTLEGETDVMEIADYLLGEMLSDDALADAIKAQEVALKQRRERIEWRAERKRAVLLDLLNAAGVKKLERPRATVFQRAGVERAYIVDADSVPTQLCTVKEIKTPDLNAIKRRLKAGETVPGAELARGPDGVTVRVN